MAAIKTVFKLVADNKTKRAFKEVDRSLDDAQKGISNLSGKIAGLVGAAGMGLMIKTQLDAAKGTIAWSKALDVNVETLSSWQYAAKEMNIEGEKMADVMKDVSEKIGDAFANNAGEAKEVMERLNLSMADMVRLSPDKQILAIANSLDQVGTQAEKIQIMEALGSDLSKMLPLLDDNAAGLHKLMEEGRAAGAVMNQAQAEGMQAMNDTLRRINASNTALSKSFTLAFGDSLANSVSYLSSTAIPAFKLMAERIGLIEMNIAGLDETGARVRITMLTEELVELNEEIATTNADASKRWGSGGMFDDLEENKARVVELNKELDALNTRLTAVTQPVVAIGGGEPAPVVGDYDASEGGGSKAEKLQEDLMTEEELLRFSQAIKLRDEQAYNDQQVAMAETAKQQKIDIMGQTFGTLAVLTASSSKKMFKIGKAASIVSAIINTHQAITKTMAETPYPWNIPLAIAQGAAGLVQVQNIKSQTFSGARELGGPVASGSSYLVGERGPEIFTPNNGGNITRNDQIGGAPSITFAPVIQAFDPDEVANNSDKLFNSFYNRFIDRMNEEGLSFS